MASNNSLAQKARVQPGIQQLLRSLCCRINTPCNNAQSVLLWRDKAGSAHTYHIMHRRAYNVIFLAIFFMLQAMVRMPCSHMG